MNIVEIMTHDVRSCRPEDTLERAAQLMWGSDLGCIPVCSGDEQISTVGVITDRDICMNALFQGRTLKELRVADAMARQVLACRPQDNVAKAERLMREGRASDLSHA